MTSDTSIRCVVWFGEPTSVERTRLAQAGWHTRVADASAQGGGVRMGGGQDRHVIQMIANASLDVIEDVVRRDNGM